MRRVDGRWDKLETNALHKWVCVHVFGMIIASNLILHDLILDNFYRRHCRHCRHCRLCRHCHGDLLTYCMAIIVALVCQGDSRLRLLNYQNNLISKINNLTNLPCLIFLDLYNNLIDTLEGPLSAMGSLRVVMAGKNRIQKVSASSKVGTIERRERNVDTLDVVHCILKSSRDRIVDALMMLCFEFECSVMRHNTGRRIRRLHGAWRSEQSSKGWFHIYPVLRVCTCRRLVSTEC